MTCATALQSGEAEIRVLVADSTPLTSRLIANALSRDRGLAAITALPSSLIVTARSFVPHVTFISQELEGKPRTGLELLKDLRLAVASTRVIMLLDCADRGLVVEAFRSGARGVFCKEDSVDLLVRCARKVYEGQLWVNRQQLEYILEALTSVSPIHIVDALGTSLLSKREEDIVRWLRLGCTNMQIASELKISPNTVKNCLFRIYDKLGVSSRVEAVLYSTRQNVNYTAERFEAL